MEENNYLLVGAPNVGKSTTFNKLTWKTSQVANYDNVTSSNLTAKLRGTKDILITDTPGTYGINHTVSKDCVTLKTMINKNYHGVINIVSANALKRDLYTTLDILESGKLEYLVINMIDELKHKKINIISLERRLGCKVFTTSSLKGSGIKELKAFLITTHDPEKKVKTELNIKYNKKILDLANEFSKQLNFCTLNPIFITMKALLNNQLMIERLQKEGIYDDFLKLKSKFKVTNKDVEEVIKQKENFINEIYEKAYIDVPQKKESTEKERKFRNSFNKLSFNPLFVIPTFILILIFIYFITFDKNYGIGWIVEQINGGFEELINIMRKSMEQQNMNPWTINFLSNGLFDGIFTTLGFIPWIMSLTFFTVILEQTGYLSRISIVLDRVLEKFGISGRTIVNMIMGIGCNIPSIMMCKNCNNKKEKVVTTMILPLISCGARITVFGWIVNAMGVDKYSFLIIFGLTAFSIIVALFAGLTFSNTLFRKTKTIFMSEVVSWKIPNFAIALKSMLTEVVVFLKRVFVIIFFVSIVIWLLSNIGPSGLIQSEDNLEKSFMYYISYPFNYILYPAGLYEPNGRLATSLIGSFPAKEIASGVLDTLYGSPESFHEWLKDYHHNLYPAVLASYLTFFLFYIPCFATMVVMKKELGGKYLTINILGVLLGSIILSCIMYSVVGSISTFSSNCYTNADLSLFIILIILTVLISTINIIRTKLQDLGKFELNKLNLFFRIFNITTLSVMMVLIITNNVLLVNGL